MNYEQRIYITAISEGMPKSLALLIVAQSKHESGNYTSNVFKTCNNLFGYKWVGQKGASQGIKSTEGDFYARYASVEDSVRELTNWIKRRLKEKKFPALDTITNAVQYATALKACGYYGDSPSHYVAGLNHYYKDNIPTA